MSGDTITRSEVLALSINLPDSTTGVLVAGRLSGALLLTDSTAGALPLTRVSGDTITRSEVLALSINLPDSTTGVLAAGRISGAINLADSVTGMLAAGNLPTAFSQLTVDAPTFVVDHANNRVGIGTNTPGELLTVVGKSNTTDTVRIYNANLCIDSGFLILRSYSEWNGGDWDVYPYPTQSAYNGVILYAIDTGFGSNFMCRDENGNVTNLAPHLFTIAPQTEPLSWSHWSMNEQFGGTINVDMLKVVRIVERLSGQKLVHISPSGTNPTVDSEALERYLESGGQLLTGEVERLSAENAELRETVQELLRRVQTLEGR